MKKKTENKQFNTPKAKGAKPQKMVPFSKALDSLVDFAVCVIIGSDACSDLIFPYAKDFDDEQLESFLRLLGACVVYGDTAKDFFAGKSDMELPLFFAGRIRDILGLNKWDKEEA